MILSTERNLLKTKTRDFSVPLKLVTDFVNAKYDKKRLSYSKNLNDQEMEQIISKYHEAAVAIADFVLTKNK